MSFTIPVVPDCSGCWPSSTVVVGMAMSSASRTFFPSSEGASGAGVYSSGASSKPPDILGSLELFKSIYYCWPRFREELHAKRDRQRIEIDGKVAGLRERRKKEVPRGGHVFIAFPTRLLWGRQS
jgi:hypothetical protein